MSTKAAFSDVTVEFHCSRGQHTMIGLSAGPNDNNHYGDIDCAIYCDSNHLVVYERGRLKLLDAFKKLNHGPPYQEKDTIAVRRQGEDVQYLFKGKVIRTCGLKLNGEVFADGTSRCIRIMSWCPSFLDCCLLLLLLLPCSVSIHNSGGGGLLQARWIGSVKRPAVDAGHPVAWTSLVGVKSSKIGSGSFTKTGKKNGWNAGAVSTYKYGGNIAIKFKCSVGQSVMVGLSASVNANVHYGDVDCALYCDKTRTTVYESGSERKFKVNGKTGGGSYGKDTVMTVQRRGRNVLFLKDDKLLYTCNKELTGKVYADSSVYWAGKGGLTSARYEPSYLHALSTANQTGIEDRHNRLTD